MKDYKGFKGNKGFKGVVVYMGVVLLLFFILVLTGCAKRVYVPVESVRTEYKDRLVRDSVTLYDSIYVKERVRGDTVFLSEYKYKYLYRDKLVRDSVFVNDTIRIPLPVEKQLSKWESMKMDVGGWAIGVISGIVLLGVGYVIVWLVMKKFR